MTRTTAAADDTDIPTHDHGQHGHTSGQGPDHRHDHAPEHDGAEYGNDPAQAHDHGHEHGHGHDHGTEHEPDHDHDHEPDHDHDHEHGHVHDHEHGHVHTHEHGDAHGDAHGHGHGHHHGRPRPRRDGILLAAFGAALPEVQVGYELFAAEVRDRYPDHALHWAFTAHKVRRKLAARGMRHDSVAEALSRLHDQGVTHLAVQSLHTVPGVEYHWTLDQAMVYRHPRKGFVEVGMGSPLLASQTDLDRVSLGLASYIPAERRPDEAVVLVAHGTYHQGHQRYLDWEAGAREQDPLLFLGALMGRPGGAEIVGRLRQSGARRVWLLPFMSVPGHHVQVDVYGASPQSWKGLLESAGFQVMTKLTGTLLHAPFRAVWMEHLEAAVASLADKEPGNANGVSCGAHTKT